MLAIFNRAGTEFTRSSPDNTGTEAPVLGSVFSAIVPPVFIIATVGRLGLFPKTFASKKHGNKNNKTIYIQVAYMLLNEETKKREFGNLKLIADNYPKYVVSLDPFNSGSDYEGIKHIHLREFLKMTIVDFE